MMHHAGEPIQSAPRHRCCPVKVLRPALLLAGVLLAAFAQHFVEQRAVTVVGRALGGGGTCNALIPGHRVNADTTHYLALADTHDADWRRVTETIRASGYATPEAVALQAWTDHGFAAQLRTARFQRGTAEAKRLAEVIDMYALYLDQLGTAHGDDFNSLVAQSAWANKERSARAMAFRAAIAAPASSCRYLRPCSCGAGTLPHEAPASTVGSSTVAARPAPETISAA